MAFSCPDLNLAFIHAPKTGGSSITAALRPWLKTPPVQEVDTHGWQPGAHDIGAMHSHWDEVKSHLQSLPVFVFGCCRNPYRLVESLWSYHRQGRTLLDFVRTLRTNPQSIRRNAGNYFRDGKLLTPLQFIGPDAIVLRHEDLEDEFEMFWRAMVPSIEPPELPHANRNESKTPAEWCEESMSIVYDLYQHDIDTMNYDFPGNL